MRTTSLTNLLLSEAKRKPHVAALVARVQQMTEEEIKEADVPLPWFRLALLEMKNNAEVGEYKTAILSGAVPGISHGFSPEVEGIMVAWTEEDTWIALAKQGQMDNVLMVPTGTLIFFPDAGGMWIDSIFVPRPTIDLGSTKLIGRTNRMGYKIAQRERIQNGPDMIAEHGTNTDNTNPDGVTASGAKFRITRH